MISQYQNTLPSFCYALYFDIINTNTARENADAVVEETRVY